MHFCRILALFGAVFVESSEMCIKRDNSAKKDQKLQSMPAAAAHEKQVTAMRIKQ